MIDAPGDLLEWVRGQFVGLETRYRVVEGESLPRRYLDSAASTLMMRPAFEVGQQFLHHYANTHSVSHFSARISTQSYHWAHERVLSFVGAPKDRFTCVFLGSGSTAGFNRVARLLRKIRPERDTVLVSLMEHHSNDLPHRQGGRYESVPLVGSGRDLGAINLAALERRLEQIGHRVNYITVSAASNVTGIVNPVHEVARLAHRHGALVVVDGSQSAAHLPTNMFPAEDPQSALDAFVFSGHKAYAPGSPGVMVVRNELLEQAEPEQVGGGMVDRVFRDHYLQTPSLMEREEAGTPNIVGAIVLGVALETLDQVGMKRVAAHEDAVFARLLEGLRSVQGLVVYGDTKSRAVSRAPTVAFNLEGVEHGMLARLLNDRFNVAVRNECFCAQPYVRAMLQEDLWDLQVEDVELEDIDNFFVNSRLGMVRASIGLYTTDEDVDALVNALQRIQRHGALWATEYREDQGEYRHEALDDSSCRGIFDPQRALDEVLARSQVRRLVAR